MKKYNYNKIMLSICTLLSLALNLASCARGEPRDNMPDTEAARLSAQAELKASEDMGQEYIDGIIFIGESTTYHLKSRGVLKDGKNTDQVWSTSAGTMMLDSAIADIRIVYPQTHEQISIGEAARRAHPKIFVLTFGLNGAVSKIERGEEYYKSCYLLLVDELRKNSPDSEIIIQACPPIADNMDTSAYRVSADTLNSYIDTLNGWAKSMCAEQGIYYLASDVVLKDKRGYLDSAYQVGDGYHLNAEAYEKMLYYMRTHAIVKEECE